MAIEIRIATREDIPALESLITQSAKKLSQGFYNDDQIESALEFIFGVDTQLIDDGTYFVAQDADETVGAGGWSKRTTLYGGDRCKKEKIDSLLDPTSEPARVRAFFVHPNWSRRGIGRQILAACEDAAALAGFRRVELIATLPGVPFYSKLGYSKFEPVIMEMPNDKSIGGYRMGKELREIKDLKSEI